MNQLLWDIYFKKPHDKMWFLDHTVSGDKEKVANYIKCVAELDDDLMVKAILTPKVGRFFPAIRMN